MFTLHFTNFPQNGSREYGTLESAEAAGRKAGFEFTVWQASRLVLSWTVFGGTRRR